MPKLVNESVGSIFTIPNKDWVKINKRVGEVLSVQKIQNMIVEYLPDYPALLASSKMWKRSTFQNIINQSKALAEYADSAITMFTSLNSKVKKVEGNIVPDSLKVETQNVLKILADNTTTLANTSNSLSEQVLKFLQDNERVDVEIEANKEKLGIFWADIGHIISALEKAAGLVAGSWKAITDDLNNTLASPIEVTMPFIESLNIEAALVSWTSLKSEALNFSASVKDQSQYWSKS